MTDNNQFNNQFNAQAQEAFFVPGRVAVLSLSALGDLLLALPLIGECRRLFPGVHLTVVCMRPATAALARELGVADDVLSLPANARRSPLSLRHSLRQMKSLCPDMTLQTWASHGTFGNLLAGATAAPVRVGFDSGRLTHHLTHLVPGRDDRHRILLNLDLLGRLGHAGIAPPDGRFLPPVENAAPRFTQGTARARFGRYVVVSAGSDPTLAFKRWPGAKWAALCRVLSQDEGLRCVFVGGADERAAVEAIVAAAGPDAAVNLAGETAFGDVAALIAHSEAVVGTDGMVLHLSSAMGRPCVGLFGPTSPQAVGAWGRGHEVVRLGLPCSPCYGAANIGRGIRCTTYECMRFLPVEAVQARVRAVLSTPV